MNSRLMTSSVIPARSRLLRLEPLGVGTSDCESLPGYIDRLAALHGVNSIALTNHVRSIPSMDGEPYGLNAALKPYWSKTPGLLAVRLARLTVNPKVAVLGMPWADFTISFRAHIRREPAWCPVCWHEDMEEGRPPYDRLVWNFGMYGYCLRHCIKLESSCPECGWARQGGATGNALGSSCRWCGSSLLARGVFSPNRYTEDDPPGNEIRYARLLAELVIAMPNFGNAARRLDVEGAIAMIKVKADHDFPQAVLDELKKGDYGRTRRRQVERMRPPVGIGAAVRLAALSGMPIAQLLKPSSRRQDFDWIRQP